MTELLTPCPGGLWKYLHHALVYNGSTYTMPWWMTEVLTPCLGESRKYLHHALVDDGVTASLADDQVRPLDNDDGHEKSRVASELQHLALTVRL